MEGAFTLRAAILDTVGVTVGLLVVVITISEEEKLWSGSRIMALRMFSSATVRSWGWKPVDRLRRWLVGGGPWVLTYCAG